MLFDKLNSFIDKIENLVRDPERFLTNKYRRYRNLNGFRIELYTARKYNSICSKFKWLRPSNVKITSTVPEKRKASTTPNSPAKHSEKTFCPYCEKAVVPKRLHKLDFADFIIVLLTAGFWAIFLFAMYLFIRRCPICNYNLRGFKFLSEQKRR